MTTPNPTPTTREREAARELLRWIRNNETYTTFDQRVDHFAAALARERREAQAEQMERDCKAVCMSCFSGLPVVKTQQYGFAHEMTWGIKRCDASDIRAAAIERLRDSK